MWAQSTNQQSIVCCLFVKPIFVSSLLWFCPWTIETSVLWLFFLLESWVLETQPFWLSLLLPNLRIGNESSANNLARTTSAKSIFCELERIVSCFCFDSVNFAEQYLHFTITSSPNFTRTCFQSFPLLASRFFPITWLWLVEFDFHNVDKQTYHCTKASQPRATYRNWESEMHLKVSGRK